MKAGWRRENPDYNPQSVGCPRDMKWLEGSKHAWLARWHWQSECWSKETEWGHWLLYVEIQKQNDRPDSCPFTLCRVERFPAGLPENYYIEYPDGLPEELQPAFLALYEPLLAAHSPQVRMLAFSGLHRGSYSYGQSYWPDYKKYSLRGISAVLDAHYKAWRRYERDKLTKALIEIAVKHL